MSLNYINGFKLNELFTLYTSGVKNNRDKEIRNGFFTSKVLSDIYNKDKSGQFVARIGSHLDTYTENTNHQISDQSTQKIPSLNLEIVNEIAKGLDLIFVHQNTSTSSATGGGNLCFINNSDELRDEFKQTFSPIDLLNYIYAVLHSPSYQEKYQEFLKLDFPRVPYPENTGAFWQLVNLGAQLRKINLMESSEVNNFLSNYPKEGTNEITTRIGSKDWQMVDEEKHLGRIWINNTQYFDNIPLSSWELNIDGYQPAQKWLKDRRNSTLNIKDILHYQRIIAALTKTERLIGEIDKISDKW